MPKKPKDLVMLIVILLVGVILGLQVKVASAARSSDLVRCLTVCENEYDDNKYNHSLEDAIAELDVCRSHCFEDNK